MQTKAFCVRRFISPPSSFIQAIILGAITLWGCGGGGGGAAAPPSLWTQLVGTLFDDVSFAIATDNGGNVLVVGYTTGAFGDLPQPGFSDSVLFKYDPSGARVLTRQFDGLDHDMAYGVAADANGNIFVTGTMVPAGAPPGGPSNVTRVGYLIKSDGNGNLLWSRVAGGAGGVATDSSGNAYVTDGGGVAVYDSAGTLAWRTQFSLPAAIHGIAINTSREVQVAGGTASALDGNANAGGLDVFAIKYDSAGARLWTRQLGTANDDMAFGIATDSSGNVYLAGDTAGDLDGNINAGGNDAFVVKYDSSGNKLWTRQLGTAAADHAAGVVTDASGNVYVAGHTEAGLDGNTNIGYVDIFIAKYDGAGNKLWTRQTGSDVGDFTSGIAIDASGNIYVTGSTDSFTLDGKTSAGSREIFIVKYDRNGNKK